MHLQLHTRRLDTLRLTALDTLPLLLGTPLRPDTILDTLQLQLGMEVTLTYHLYRLAMVLVCLSPVLTDSPFPALTDFKAHMDFRTPTDSKLLTDFPILMDSKALTAFLLSALDTLAISVSDLVLPMEVILATEQVLDTAPT